MSCPILEASNMDSHITVSEKTVKQDIIIPPLRNTFSLEISPDQTQICDIARKQLDNLNKVERKPKRKITPPSSDTETIVTPIPIPPKPELIHDASKQMHNLSSAIVSKAELENEIRQKVAKQDPIRKVGITEIPQELILSGLNTTPMPTVDGAAQLHDQELIDILEGKSGDETEVFEVVHQLVHVHNDGDEEDSTSYEIVSADDKVIEAKAKLLEREIAMRQIASLPVRKNKKGQSTSKASTSPHQSIVQSLAAEWTDDDKEDEMILELVNMEGDGESKIKILNMTILNEATDAKPKVARQSGEQASKIEPKILNKEAPKTAPKILNINASAVETPASFKRSRVIKKKEIWDPSATAAAEKKPIEKMSVSLPPSITIKKLTKESISKAQVPIESATITPIPIQKPPPKKAKKRSEIDKLLQDEGAVNMIYSLERENNNKDVPEIDVKPDQKSLIDKSQEKTSMVTKAKTIKNVVLKQSSSSPEVKPAGRVRAKRDATPVKIEQEPAVAVTKAQKAPAAASRKKKADNSWDYIYSQAQATCDDAMIIRRRSNSSYSSSAASPRRLSVDVNESLESPPASAKKIKRDSKETFEFTKPPLKNTKSPADKLLQKDFVDQLRGKISNVLTRNKEKLPVTVTKGRKRAAPAATETSATPAKRASERRSNGSDHKEYRLVKDGKIAHIIINQNPLSISLLSEMKSVLNQLETDDCQVVLITSSEGFSEGLDYSTLVQATVDKRKQAASDLVTAFKFVEFEDLVCI